MEPLIWIALLVAVVVGMCLGSAISRDQSRPFLHRAWRAEEALQALQAQYEGRPSPPEPVYSERTTPPPVVVNVHIPASPGWPMPSWPPVVDGQVVPALPVGEQR